MIGVTAIVLATFAVACGGGSAASEPTIRLTITVWPEGRAAGGAKQWTLRCNPTGGTHPTRTRACARLNALRDPFRPVPKDAACTQIYGGPQEARVQGVYKGRGVDARFNRRDGCQIARWDRIRVLFPVAVGTAT
jgi:hypothetical protein